MLGHQKPIATCSLHVEENARKKCKTGWNENYFWRLQQARSRRERDAAWAAIERAFPPAAINYLCEQLEYDLSNHGRPWTRFANIQKENARSVKRVLFQEAYRFFIPEAQ